MAIRPVLKRAEALKKSKASDYNDNFDAMMDFIDDSVGEAKDYVDDFMPDVTDQGGKYLTNNGTTTSWASLGNQPFGDFINGLIITKSSDDTIAISAGSCYDYTKTTVLTNGSATTKQNSTQDGGKTYYVYIIDGASTDFLITISSSNPTLPTGSTTYRQIGYYTTDSDNKIDSISYYGVDNNSDKSANGVANSIFPDYTAGIVLTENTNFTAPSAGLVWVSAEMKSANGNSLDVVLSVNNLKVGETYSWHNGGGNTLNCYAFVTAGDVVKYEIVSKTGTPNLVTKFFPAKGAN